MVSISFSVVPFVKRGDGNVPSQDSKSVKISYTSLFVNKVVSLVNKYDPTQVSWTNEIIGLLDAGDIICDGTDANSLSSARVSSD